ncbi:MAG: head-tail adaptor protein [Streptococcaceae bacterium]|jgi:hypothetical protein|nr:head-tail adaptor protein [Streptococcaceae bacterium]
MALSRTGKLTKRMIFKKQNGYKKGVNGIKEPNYEEVIKPWFAYKQKFLNEIKSESTVYKNTLNIIIRQRQKEIVTPDWIAEIDGNEYQIIEINPDVENDDFMLIVLKAVH